MANALSVVVKDIVESIKTVIENIAMKNIAAATRQLVELFDRSFLVTINKNTPSFTIYGTSVEYEVFVGTYDVLTGSLTTTITYNSGSTTYYQMKVYINDILVKTLYPESKDTKINLEYTEKKAIKIRVVVQGRNGLNNGIIATSVSLKYVPFQSYSFFQMIADIIRYVESSEDKIKPIDMAERLKKFDKLDVVFYDNDGETIYYQTRVAIGTKMVYPDDPEDSSKGTFLGWGTDLESGDINTNIPERVFKNISLYAVFVPYLIYYYGKGEEFSKKQGASTSYSITKDDNYIEIADAGRWQNGAKADLVTNALDLSQYKDKKLVVEVQGYGGSSASKWAFLAKSNYSTDWWFLYSQSGILWSQDLKDVGSRKTYEINLFGYSETDLKSVVLGLSCCKGNNTIRTHGRIYRAYIA